MTMIGKADRIFVSAVWTGETERPLTQRTGHEGARSMEEEHPASTMRCLSVRAKRIERLVCAQQSYARPRERLSGRLASPVGIGRPAGLRRSTGYVITTGSATTSGCSPLTAARRALSRLVPATRRNSR